MTEARAERRHEVLVEGLFRRESAKLIASLARILGPSNIDLAEDLVQETLASALTAWSSALPDKPEAWLMKVARNRAIDAVRSQGTQRRFAAEYARELASGWTRSMTVEESLAAERADENMLRMMLSLCHPALASETHITLILKFLCGLGRRELAAAFLTSEDTIKKRLARGRAKFRELGSLPPLDETVEDRLPSVLNALYLLFNEGYHGSNPVVPARAVLCQEAMQLCDLIIRTAERPAASAHGLMALMCFHSARLESRFDADGQAVPLARQDRATWDRGLIDSGIAHLGRSAQGRALSPYHLEAGIAYKHCLAPSFEETDWPGILELYDLLFRIDASPLVAVLRAVVRAHAGDPAAAVAELAPLEGNPALAGYPFYWASRAEVHALNGDPDQAHADLARATELARSRVEVEAFQRRLEELATLSAADPDTRTEATGPKGRAP